MANEYDTIHAEFLTAFRGVPSHILATALNSLDPGVNWIGCSKADLADSWAAAHTAQGYMRGRIGHLTLDRLRGAVADKQARLERLRTAKAQAEARREAAWERERQIREKQKALPSREDLVAALRGLLDQGEGRDRQAAKELLDRWDRTQSELTALGEEV